MPTDAGPGERPVALLAFVGLLTAGLIGVSGLLVATGHPLTLLALLMCLICAIPVMLGRHFDLFAPWNYMFYFVVLNILIRSIFVDFEITGGVADLDDIFYLGKPHEFMIGAALAMLSGFVALTFGYLATPTRPTPLRFPLFNSSVHDPGRFKWTVILMLLVAAGSFVMFVKLTFTGIGDLALNMLSKHRGLSQDLNEYRAYGYLRLLIGFADLAVYLSFMRLRTSRHQKGFYRVALATGMLISLGMAFYSQSRAALVLVLLNLIFLKYYLDGGRFPWKPFLIAAPAAVALFVLVSSLRGGSGVDFEGGVSPMTIAAPIVLNIGGIDISKTGQVIDYTTQAQDYKFGQTLVQFFTAAVPRQLWPEKPPNLDTYIGEKIYGADVFGAAAVPPGFFAEMYMNFSYAGIVLGALVLGFAIKLIQNVLTANKHNVNFILVYVICLQSFGMSAMASGFSSTVTGILMSGIPLLLILRYVTRTGKPVKALAAPASTYA